MTTISVIYPRSKNATFDHRYYEATHLPLVAERWGNAGLTGAEAFRGVGAPDGGDASFFAIALIHFQSPDHLRAALEGEHAAEIMGGIPKFTNAQPLLPVNERMGA